jgi:hypothetical protein
MFSLSFAKNENIPPFIYFPPRAPSADLAVLLAGRARTFPIMLKKTGAWLEQLGRKSMIVEIPKQWINTRDYLLENGWKKQYAWLELVRWLDERTRQKIFKM